MGRRERTRGGCEQRGQQRHRESAGTLAAVALGEDVRITRIEDDDARAHALRFGMGEGTTVRCVTLLPAGPVVLRAGRQEIAVGRRLARRISVERPTAV